MFAVVANFILACAHVWLNPHAFEGTAPQKIHTTCSLVFNQHAGFHTPKSEHLCSINRRDYQLNADDRK